MIPPTSIDGTDITGATIDGTDVTEITVDGQTVFSAVQGADIDGFETGNINNYTGDTSDFTVQSTEVFEGSNSLQCNDGTITTNNPPGGVLPTFGTDFEFYWYVPSTSLPVEPTLIYESDGQDAQGYRDGYVITLQERNNRFVLFGATPGDVNGQGFDLQSISNFKDKWLQVKVTHSSSAVTVEIIDTTNQASFGTVSLSKFSTLGNLLAFNTEQVTNPDPYFLDSIRTI